MPPTLVVMIFTDASANPLLGWGAWSSTSWMWDRWNPGFLNSFQPSIDFLELYAIVVAVFVWTPNRINKTVEIYRETHQS